MGWRPFISQGHPPMKTPSPTPPPADTPFAVSYLRFSSPEQAKGDSVRRQTADSEAWCASNGVPLNTTLSMRARGVSAFRGRHRSDKEALGRFLELVRRGDVPRGSFLL